jgi:transposase
MAGKTTDMSKIKQLLRCLKEGQTSNRKMAQIFELNKETVNNYVRKAKADSLSLDQLLALDDIELEHRFKGGSPAYPEEERFKVFQEWLPKIVDEMSRRKKTHVTLKLLYEEYCAEVSNPYSLTQFRYHYNQNVKATNQRSKTVLKDTYVPGLMVYLDFAGDKMHYIDIQTGEIVPVEVFVASFPYSDYGFALAVPSQGADDFAYAITELFRSVGGAPKILVPDNLKSAVIKADRYAPKVNTLLEDLANHYGCFVQPARVRHPQDKSTVEDTVKLTYQRAYAPLRNQTFYSIEEVNAALSRCMLAHNQKRMTQYNHTREECFLANEKPNLLPLPATDYEVKRVHELLLDSNCFVYLATHKAYYSAPYQWIGTKLKVVVTRTKVKLYAHGECVAEHIYDPNKKYNYYEEHLPPKSQSWRGRNKQWYIDKANFIHSALGDYVEGVFVHCGTIEQAMYKSCDAILHLARNTDPCILIQAIETATNLDKYGFKILSNLVKNLNAGVIVPIQQQHLSPPTVHDGLRGKEAFH